MLLLACKQLRGARDQLATKQQSMSMVFLSFEPLLVLIQPKLLHVKIGTVTSSPPLAPPFPSEIGPRVNYFTIVCSRQASGRLVFSPLYALLGYCLPRTLRAAYHRQLCIHELYQTDSKAS